MWRLRQRDPNPDDDDMRDRGEIPMYRDSHSLLEREAPWYSARGGVALGPVLSGTVVAFGAMFLLSAILGAVVFATDLDDGTVTGGEAVTVGVAAAVLLLAIQFLSYLWGGYTAGRMARGAGVANGLLVAVFAILMAGAVGSIVAAIGPEARVNMPFTTTRLPIDEDLQIKIGIGLGAGMLVAMFLGGMLGGIRGARWHAKLEDPVRKPKAKKIKL